LNRATAGKSRAGAPEDVRVEMPVEVCFDDVTPDHTLVKFKPA